MDGVAGGPPGDSSVKREDGGEVGTSNEGNDDSLQVPSSRVAKGSKLTAPKYIQPNSG